MAENIGDLSLTIRVNKETGNIEIAKGEINSLGETAQNAGKGVGELTEAFEMMQKKMVTAMAGAAALAFLKKAVSESIEYDEALRHIQVQMDALNLGFDKNRIAIIAWSQTMQASAHLSDNVALTSLNRVIQKTGDLANSMKLVKLAQDISLARGDDYNEMLSRLASLAGGGQGAQRALMMLNREFGAQFKGVKDADDAMRVMYDKYSGYSEKVTGLSTEITDLKEDFSDLRKEVSSDMEALVDWFVRIGSIFAKAGTSLTKSVSATGAILLGAVTGNFSAVKTTFTELGLELHQIWDKAQKSIIESGKPTVNHFKQDQQEKLEAFRDAMTKIDREEELALVGQKNSTSKMLADYKKYYQDRVAIISAAEKNGTLTHKEATKERERVEFEFHKKSKREEERNEKTKESVVQDWYLANRNTSAKIAEVGVNTFEQLTASFGQATAKMIMEGKDFAETFEALMKNLAEQVIAQLTQIAVRAAIINMLGGPTGSIFGIPLMAVGASAAGNRATKPTLTVFGEGGEGETVVPDSGARAFAHGVMAGQASKGGGGGGMPSAGNVHIAQNINVSLHVSTLDAKDRAVVLDALTKEMRSRTKAAISFAVKASDVAGQNTGRAV